MKISFIISVVSAATVLFQIGHLAAQDSSDLPLKVNPVILPGDIKSVTCPAANILETARASIRSEVDNQITSLTSLLNRPCGCGAAIAGWRRVAFINMTDPSQTCPGDWRLLSSPRRTCVRSIAAQRGCGLASFSNNGQTYSQVCGRLIGYQYGTTDALWRPINRPRETNPDMANSTRSPYDGGVLITHGTTTRQHIWSLVSGLTQQRTDSLGCPCNVGSRYADHVLPSWLDEDYFCDSAVIDNPVGHMFYSDNPLWDGVGCDESVTTCCQFNNPPWFCKQLPQLTSDDIEVRLCADMYAERTPIELIEIYIR